VNALVTYAVGDLVIPIRDMDTDTPKNGDAGTREDWLIRKVTRTVAPNSWEGAGGTGVVRYSPRDHALVVSNTAAVQARVRYLLETMRRVQDVQVSTEGRIVSLTPAGFHTLQGLLPRLKAGGPIVLNEAEAFALVRKAGDVAGTRVVQCPKVTLFPGHQVDLSLDRVEFLAGAGKADLRLRALVAADLRRLQLEAKVAVGAVDFTGTSWLEDGATVAECKRCGDGYLMLVLTPRVIISLGDELATPGAVPPRAAEKK
jgi:hypothetical protein